MSRTALLSARGLTKRFGGLVAVDGVDFDVYAGEILGLIGPNGAGKTTTFNLVAGALAPTSGTLTFEGKPIHGLKPHEVAGRGIMRTFQHNMPFAGMSLIDNVLIGSHRRMKSGLAELVLGSRHSAREEAQARKRAEEMIDFVGLREFVGTPVLNLSFGQGRLLEVARGLAGEPRLMLFDEPAAGLTPAECERLAGVIRGIAARGIAVLLIEHDMRFLLPLAERVIVLNFGRKIADGTPDAIRDDPAVVDAYLGDPTAMQASAKVG